MSRKNSKSLKKVVNIVLPQKIESKRIPSKISSFNKFSKIIEAFKEISKNIKETEKVEKEERIKRELIEKSYKIAIQKINFLFHIFDKLSKDKLGSIKEIIQEGRKLIHKGVEENNTEFVKYGSVLLTKALEDLGSPLIGEEIEKITKNLSTQNLKDIEIDL